jgi:hypothetical protein
MGGMPDFEKFMAMMAGMTENNTPSEAWSNLDPETKLSVIDEMRKYFSPCPFVVGDIVFIYDIEEEDKEKLPMFMRGNPRYKRPCPGEPAIVIKVLEPLPLPLGESGTPCNDANMIIAMMDKDRPDANHPIAYPVHSYYFYKMDNNE